MFSYNNFFLVFHVILPVSAINLVAAQRTGQHYPMLRGTTARMWPGTSVAPRTSLAVAVCWKESVFKFNYHYQYTHFV